MKLVPLILCTCLLFFALSADEVTADKQPATPRPESKPTSESSGEATTGATTSPEDTYAIEADVTEGNYKEGEQVLILTGNVKVVHKETTLTCDKAVARELEKMLIAEGNVKVIDSKNQMTLTCGYAEYYRDKRYVVAMKNPVLVSTKNTEQPITIVSDLMEAYLDEERGVGTGNVHITSGKTNATGAVCVFYSKQDRIELTGEPEAWERDSKIVGENMTLLLRNQKVEEALVEKDVRLLFYSTKGKKKESAEDARKKKIAEGKAAGNLKAETGDEKTPVEKPKPGQKKPEEESTVYNGRLESTGDLLHAYIRDDEIRVAFMEGNSRGIYYPYDDFGKETGENMTVTGKRLTSYFAGGAVDTVVTEDNAVAVYEPPQGEEGRTITQGDVISMYVNDGKVDRILVRGNAQGSYYSTPIGSKGTKEENNASSNGNTKPANK